MTVDLMRRVDRFAGIPLCLAAGLWRCLRPGRTPSSGPPMTIVVMKFFGIGSVLLSTAFVNALRRRHPHARILYITFLSSGEILRSASPSVEVVTIDTSSLRAFLRNTLAAIRLLRSVRADVVFDLEFFSKFSTLLSTVTGAPVRVGFALPTRWRRMNVTHAVPLDHGAHVTDVFLRQLSALGDTTTPPCPVSPVHPTPSDRDAVRKKLPMLTPGAGIICVNINAGLTSVERRWPPERHCEVVSAVALRHPEMIFCFTGAASERAYVGSVLAGAPHLARIAVNCAGLLTLGELIALFERSALLLTADSGPMHIAAAAGLPVVALFGPESPALYGPRGQGSVLYKAIPCSPCLTVYNAKLFVCPYNARCMTEITTAEVLAAVSRLLEPATEEVA